MEKKFVEIPKKYILIGILVVLIVFIITFMIFYKKQYEVTFNSNGGTQIVSKKIQKNDKIEKPEDPTKEGYLFEGWYYNNELYDFDMPIMNNITLEARWTVQEEIELEEIKLDQIQLTLKMEEESQLVVSSLPENAKITKLIWNSSDETIVNVDEEGKIKALKEGNATITVKTEDEKHTATCVVTVIKNTEDTNTSKYVITLTANHQQVTNVIMYYYISVTKDEEDFNEWKAFYYNGRTITSEKTRIMVSNINTDINYVTLILSNENKVTARVIYDN